MKKHNRFIVNFYIVTEVSGEGLTEARAKKACRMLLRHVKDEIHNSALVEIAADNVLFSIMPGCKFGTLIPYEKKARKQI